MQYKYTYKRWYYATHSTNIFKNILIYLSIHRYSIICTGAYFQWWTFLSLKRRFFYEYFSQNRDSGRPKTRVFCIFKKIEKKVGLYITSVWQYSLLIEKHGLLCFFPYSLGRKIQARSWMSLIALFICKFYLRNSNSAFLWDYLEWV